MAVSNHMHTWRQLLEDPTQHRTLFEARHGAHRGHAYTHMAPFPIRDTHLRVPVTQRRVRSYGLLYDPTSTPPASRLGTHTYAWDHELIQSLNLLHGKRHGFLNLQTLEHGEGTPMHYDTNRFGRNCPVEFYPDDICKIFMFAADWVAGQTIWLGDTVLTGWRRHDCVRFPWYMPHRTANTSGVARTMFHYIGV